MRRLVGGATRNNLKIGVALLPWAAIDGLAWTQAQQLGVFRTMLGVPMLREGVPLAQ